MGVTIDNLQIEIQSDSTNAAKGIDALAKSLEGLKKNGSFKTVSTNLNNLSAALKNLPNVHQASNALRTLATSIEKLKGVGTVSSLSNSLGKLPSALKSLSGINLEKAKAQLEGVADAVSPLSAIKAGGLSSMVNAMKNLGKVTESLDDDTITAFAKKIDLLNEKLGPFAEKMATVKSAFGAINSKARSASKSVEDFGDGINTSTLNMSSFIDVARTAIDTIQQFVVWFTELTHEATQWDGIKYQFGNAFGEEADIYYEEITKITDALNINKQTFMEHSAMAASMAVGYGVASSDARKMGIGYTELAYDIWSAYNNVYESLEGADGAMAAVRSAIAGEVEPIRRAGFTIVDSQLAITAANHGLAYSTQTATEAQKSYLRYLTLVEQAQSKGVIGTYAREMNTAEGMMRTFSQQLKSLSQAFGSLFIPVLVKVMPYLQAFVELLTEGVHWIAAFFGIEIQDIGDTWANYGSGVSDAVENTEDVTGALNSATKAAKELKNATLGIDELNVISPSTATSGGGSGSGSGSGTGGGGFADLGIDSLWDETIFDTIQSDVDSIKEKLKGWMPVIASVATALAGLRLVKLLKDIDIIEKSKLFTGGLKFSFGKLKDFAGWTKAFAALAKEGGILATLAVAFPKASKALKTFTGNFGAFISLAKEGGVMQALSAAFPKIANALSKVSSKLGPIGAIVTAVTSAIVFLVENWEKLKEVAKNFFDENIAPKFTEIKKHLDKMKEALAPLAPAFEAVGKAVRWLGDAFSWLLEAIGGVIVSLVGGALAGAFNAVVSLVEGVVQAVSGSIQIFRGFADFWVAIS